jgi:peptide deformylase
MNEPKILRRTQFGNPILRTPTKMLSLDEIKSDDIKTLVADMRHTLANKKYGVGIAANQLGRSLAISVIAIKKTPARPDVTEVSMVIINPSITETFGNKTGMWEGCLSFGKVFAKAQRYKKVRVKYLDENGMSHEKVFEGLLAHVMQHETDHLHGTLFVDKVRDPKTWMTESEYIKQVKSKI